MIQKLCECLELDQARVTTKPPPRAPGEGLLEKTNQVISQHLDDHAFGVQELSHALLMDRSNLYRKLKAITGLSPCQYLRSRRLAYARELLCQTELPVAAVAYESGFSDQRYFARVFHQELGLSPTQFRASNEPLAS